MELGGGICSNPLTNLARSQTGLSGSQTLASSRPHSAGSRIGWPVCESAGSHIGWPVCERFFFCSIILALSLCKTMAALYKDHILSAVPEAQWQQRNTPIKKFVHRAQGNSCLAPQEIDPRKDTPHMRHSSPSTPHPRHSSPARHKENTSRTPHCQEPVGHYPPGSSSSSLTTPAAATARSSSSSSLSQFSSTGGAARPT